MKQTISSKSASSRPRGAGVKTALAPSEVWVDVVVNQKRIRLPKQALYDAASDLRLATEAHVSWEDCASVVVRVLTAMNSHGELSIYPDRNAALGAAQEAEGEKGSLGGASTLHVDRQFLRQSMCGGTR